MEKLVPLLNEDGYPTTRVSSAQEAWNKIQSTGYEVIIIDASEDIVVRNGRCLSELVSEYYPSILRIGISACALVLLESLVQDRYQKLLQKPVRVEDIIRAIETPFYRK
jgi:CheY-like chemotaxis protein